MDIPRLSTRCFSRYEGLQDRSQFSQGMVVVFELQGWWCCTFCKPVVSETLPMMDGKQAIWIKDPLAILADRAERGIVIQNGRIVELVPAGREPAAAGAGVYEAGAHVVLPGLINTHHHFY